MLRYLTVPVTPFAQNCSFVWCDQTLQAAVIDPGGDLDVLLAEVKRLGLQLGQIWLTHAHIDHAGAAGALAKKLHLPIIGPHEADQFWIDGLPAQSQMFGFAPAMLFKPTRWLHDGDTDFPQGNHADLMASIKNRLWPMGDDTVFIPGHGPESTFGRERRTNPYVADV